MNQWTFPIDADVSRRIVRRERLSGFLAKTRAAGALRRLARVFDAGALMIERRRTDEQYRTGNLTSGYTGTKEEMSFFQYKAEVDSARFAKIRSPSFLLYREQENILSELLARFAASPFINFGVSYAYIDALLARKFPQTKFIGVDRSRYTKALNEVEFGAIPNLSFEASDIAEQLNGRNGGILFHSRTMCLLAEADAHVIYKRASAGGIRYIAGFEPIGLSRQTLAAYRFSLSPQPTVHLRHFMFIHNYPWMLTEAGFEIEKFYTIKTNSPHRDMSILCFVAKNRFVPSTNP